MAWNIKMKSRYWDFLGYGLPLFAWLAWHAWWHGPPPYLNYMGTRELPAPPPSKLSGCQLTTFDHDFTTLPPVGSCWDYKHMKRSADFSTYRIFKLVAPLNLNRHSITKVIGTASPGVKFWRALTLKVFGTGLVRILTRVQTKLTKS
jgi:hypothetical protein